MHSKNKIPIVTQRSSPFFGVSLAGILPSMLKAGAEQCSQTMGGSCEKAMVQVKFTATEKHKAVKASLTKLLSCFEQLPIYRLFSLYTFVSGGTETKA